MDRTTVLVIDDDPSVGRFLSRTLKREGFTVLSALSVAEAWPLIENHSLDLILVDKSMPRESGLVLLERLQESQYEIPAVLITGDANAETIDEALRLGAEDYISKPFLSPEHLMRRLHSVLDRHIAELLFDVMLSDLSKAVLSGTGRSKEFTKLSQSVLELKVKLGKRPACAIVDDDVVRCESRRRAIYDSGVIAVGVDPSVVDVVFGSANAPMVAAVALECVGSLALMQEMHEKYPKLLLLAFATTADVHTALKAIEVGAADFTLLRSEGMSACSQRIERLVRQARRHHLYLEIIAVLYRAAREVRPDLAEDLIFATASDTERPYLAMVP